jgi:hypothetical protein
MYKQESEEPKVTIGKLSAKSVSDLVQAESGIRISDRTMQQAIKDNKAGLSPRKPGRPGYFLELVFDHMAFETYIKKLIPCGASLPRTHRPSSSSKVSWPNIPYATQGEACNSEDTFLSIEKNVREAQLK